MENKGILVGQLQNIKGEQNKKNPQKMDVVCDFIDTNGQQYSNIKMYGYTAEEVSKRGNSSWAVLNYSLSVRTSASNQTATGESVFALFVRDAGFIHPNDVQCLPVMNNFELTGVLAEDPVQTQENGQLVVDIKVNVIRRNLNKEPDTKNGNAFDLLSLRLRKPTHIELISNCGKESTVCINGRVNPIPGSYIVNTEITGLQIFFQKPLSSTNMMNGATQMYGTSQMNNQNTFNSGKLRLDQSTNRILDDHNSEFDAYGNMYNFPALQAKGAAGLNPNTGYIVDSQSRLINSEGELIDEYGQLLQNNVQTNNNMNQMGQQGQVLGQQNTNQYQAGGQQTQAWGQQNTNQFQAGAQQQGFGQQGANQFQNEQQQQGFGQQGANQFQTGQQLQGFGQQNAQINNNMNQGGQQQQGFGQPGANQFQAGGQQQQGFGQQNTNQFQAGGQQQQGFGQPGANQFQAGGQQPQGFGQLGANQFQAGGQQQQGFGQQNTNQFQAGGQQQQGFGQPGANQFQTQM